MVASEDRPALPPGPYLVVGLARSGVAACRALKVATPGERVVGTDLDRPAEVVEAAEILRALEVELSLGTDGTELLAEGVAPKTLVKSPGVPQDAPVVVEARRLGVSVIGELELAWRLLPNRFVAVTGTNGKTTTTELLGAMYTAADQPCAVAGNVGLAASSLVGEIGAEPTVVCEVSSFQLEDSIAFRPEVAVFLNFDEDHLDRHPSVGAYLDAKLRIFANQKAGDLAVLNADDPALRGAEIPGQARRIWFGTNASNTGTESMEEGARTKDIGGDVRGQDIGGDVRGQRAQGILPSQDEGGEHVLDIYEQDGTVFWQGAPLISVDGVRLRGRHNLENAMAAAATALSLGLPQQAVTQALTEFPGVAHRLEEVGVHAGVLYVNDSKATNVASATVGVMAFTGGVHLILGGSSKGGTFKALRGPIGDHCRAVYLIGEAAERLDRDLEGIAVPALRCGDLETAVKRASAAASAGEVVLLSPACASFDQYESYEERGAHFRALVRGLEA